MSDQVAFDCFRIDRGRRQLFDSRIGGAVAIPPRVFDTLLHLIDRAGQLVTKSDLMDAIWPGVIVEENSLSQNVSQLRRVLGDDGDGRRFVVTAPGRGYRFVGELKATFAPPPTSSVTEGTQSAGASNGDSEKSRTSLAVLAFANLTGDPGKDYLGEGMAEEVLDLLSHCTGLRLTSLGRSVHDEARVLALAREAGIDALLTGSIRGNDAQLRISVKLIDLSSDELLWSRSFNRRNEDVLTVQAEVAAAVADVLSDVLNSSITSLRDQPAPPADVETHHLFLRAQWLGGFGSESQYRASIEMLREVVRRVPDFARGHAELARSICHFNGSLHIPIAEILDEADAAADRALELDPLCLPAAYAKGSLAALRGEWVIAESFFAKVMAEQPGDRWGSLPMATMLVPTMGHLESALEQLQKLERFIPFTPFLASATALGQILVGDTAGAKRNFARALQLGTPPTMVVYAEGRAYIHASEGEWSQAAELVIGTLDAEARTRQASTIRNVYRAIVEGHGREAALGALAALHRDGVAPLDLMTRKRLILWYTQLGEVDFAVDLLAQIVADMKVRGFGLAYWSFLWLPVLKPLQRHPDFVAIAREIGMVDYWQVHGPPDGYLFDGQRLIPRN